MDGKMPEAAAGSAPVDGADRASRIAAFRGDLVSSLPGEAFTDDPLRRLAYGTDASFYRLTPALIVHPGDEDQVRAILAAARRHRVGLTFRAAGTSLSGQAITDQVLVMIGRRWSGMRHDADRGTIHLGPAVIGAHANAILRPHGHRIGPDPASIDAAHIGGIAANNASGMCCGTAQNSYRTLAGLRVMLADGAVLDTADGDSRAAFAESHAALLDALAALRDEVRADTALAGRVRRKFAIKNTTGYSLNALVDFDDPVDILAHLMIGSEGTLGFLSRIDYRTVPDPEHRSAALVFFRSIRDACALIPALRAARADAVELLDRASLRSVEGRPGMLPGLSDLPEAVAALLIEVRGSDPGDLAARLAPITAALADAALHAPAAFTDDPGAIKRFWAVRKGTFPSVGAMRASGTAVIIEDVAVPPDRLADAAEALRALFDRHGYGDAILFGHALEGNLHFVLTPDFAADGAVARYAGFMDDLAELIVGRFDGSLKAEHGTGRNMAPFVEMEWGAQAYRLMVRIKELFDPGGILNPGVILNDDKRVHTANIKPLPAADPAVDKCIECGFCEPVCPSRGYTLTPRQRIVGLREMARLERSGEDPATLAALRRAYPADAVQSCALDHLCATACPVGIDTGAVMQGLRAGARGPVARWVGARIAGNFAVIAFGTREALRAADLLHRLIGTRAMSALTGTARRLSRGRIPLWTPAMPRAGRIARVPAPRADRKRVVYLPSCASRVMGPARGDPEDRALSEPVVSLMAKAGYDVIYPDGLGALCCGQPLESKGLTEAADTMRTAMLDRLRTASRGGRDPVVFDTSPCAQRALDSHPEGLDLHDLPDFLHDHVLPRLDIAPQAGPVAIHHPCATLKRQAPTRLEALVRACAGEAVHPLGIHCCGWSGDRGFTLPDLNANALAGLRAALPPTVGEGASSSRTCEIGLSHHSGRPYRSVAYLLDRVSRPWA